MIEKHQKQNVRTREKKERGQLWLSFYLGNVCDVRVCEASLIIMLFLVLIRSLVLSSSTLMDLELGTVIRIVIIESCISRIGVSDTVALKIRLVDETGLVSFKKHRMREFQDNLVFADDKSLGIVMKAQALMSNGTSVELYPSETFLSYDNDVHDIVIPRTEAAADYRIKISGQYIPPSEIVPIREVVSAYTRVVVFDGIQELDFRAGGLTCETHRKVESPFQLYVVEDTSNYGFCGILWPAENALCSYIWRNRLDFRDKTVLELGCCTGVAGIAIALSGARFVALTDQKDILGLTRRNIEENKVALEQSTGVGTKIEVCEHIWGSEEALVQVSDSSRVTSIEESRFDYIVAGDLLYDPAYYDDLWVSINYFAREGTKLLLGIRRRNELEDIFFGNRKRNSRYNWVLVTEDKTELKYCKDCKVLLFVAENK